MFHRKISVFLVVATALLLSLTINSVSAQDGQTILQIAVPDNIGEQLQNGLLDQFAAANPGIQVQVIETGGGRFGFFGGSGDVGAYLDGIKDQVSQADVVLINTSDVTPESTRAGYFLDLSPLVAVDNSLNVNDFYQPVWNSYQWDGGIWALPVAANVSVLLYDPAAFDNANLNYPTELVDNL